MEYVFIEFPEGRVVMMDGQELGETNQTLLVDEGHHTFDLGDPVDYSPPSIMLVIESTTELKPKRICFEKA